MLIEIDTHAVRRFPVTAQVHVDRHRDGTVHRMQIESLRTRKGRCARFIERGMSHEDWDQLEQKVRDALN